MIKIPGAQRPGPSGLGCQPRGLFLRIPFDREFVILCRPRAGDLVPPRGEEDNNKVLMNPVRGKEFLISESRTAVTYVAGE